MKHGKRFTTLAVALALVCGLVLGAGAAGASQQIQAYLTMGRTVTYNGEVQTMKDANGKTVYPISYQGSTYLPIRAIADMLGIQINWDAATQTVVLGTPAEGVDLIETYKPYTSYAANTASHISNQFFQNKDKITVNAGGVEISHGIGFCYNGWNHREITTSFNIGGKYNTLTFKVYANVDTLLTVKGDNDHVFGEYNLVGGRVPQTITVNLLNTTQLSFVRDGGNCGVCYIFDAFLN